MRVARLPLKTMPRKNPQLETILDSIADGVFTINPDHEITSFNRAAEQITGIKHEQAIGQKCFDVFHANICQGRCAMEKTLKTGKTIIDLPVSISETPKGDSIPISVSTAVLKNDRGEIIGGVETFRDLSAIEAMRRELSRQYCFGDIISKNHEIVILFGVLPDIAQAQAPSSYRGPAARAKSCLRVPSITAEPGNRPVCGGQLRRSARYAVESELFGYCKGAFTDAKADKLGRFAQLKAAPCFSMRSGICRYLSR